MVGRFLAMPSSTMPSCRLYHHSPRNLSPGKLVIWSICPRQSLIRNAIMARYTMNAVVEASSPRHSARIRLSFIAPPAMCQRSSLPAGCYRCLLLRIILTAAIMLIRNSTRSLLAFNPGYRSMTFWSRLFLRYSIKLSRSQWPKDIRCLRISPWRSDVSNATLSIQHWLLTSMPSMPPASSCCFHS